MYVKTKFHIPHVRSSLVSRPKLMRKLNEGMEAKLMLVSAQAGYGKTTALSEWAKQCSALVAWVSLDKLDNDWISFWSCVMASIKERVPDFGLSVIPFLERGPMASSEPMIKALLNELNQLSDELVIILDDYHTIEIPAIHQSLGYLLELLPTHVHLYIASRMELNFPTSRLLAKGDMHRINMQDLRFRLDEGLVFFRDMTDLSLTKEQVKVLFNQTEGWISGLQLASISLKRSDNIAESIRQFSGQQHHISDYLLEEVLQHQSESMRAFLLDTSILSRMNHSLCQAVTGQLNSDEQLERLEQLNLFIVPLDDQRHWYRYHHLLTDFLQKIGSRADPLRWKQTHIQAANWLESHGFEEEAVEHYLEGEQVADAVRIIEKNLPSFMQSKSTALMRWVSYLPEASFADNPMIEIFNIFVLLVGGQWEVAYQRTEQAQDRVKSHQGKLPDDEWNKLMGIIYFLCAIASYFQKNLARSSDYFELAERYMPEGSYFQMMGRNRYQGYDSTYDPLMFVNDLHEAEQFLLKWIKIWDKKEKYPFIAHAYVTYSTLMYEWNRLDEAEFNISQVLERKEMQPFARIMIHVAVSSSRIQQAKGNPRRATELLVQLKSKIDSPDYDLFMLKIEAEQAYLSLRQGSPLDAIDWLQRCGLSHADEGSLNHFAEYLVVARVLAASEKKEEALVLLERLYRYLSMEDRLRDRIKVLILQSVTLWSSGQSKAALIPLESALQLAEPDRYIRSFIDEGFMMTEMLIAYSKVQQDRGIPSVSYVKQLLQASVVAPEEEEPFKEILTEQELRILGFIAGGLLNKEIALRLNIKSETVKFHIKNLYSKLGVNNRVQALQRAKQLHILV